EERRSVSCREPNHGQSPQEPGFCLRRTANGTLVCDFRALYEVALRPRYSKTYFTDGTWLSLQPVVPLKFRITLVRAVGGGAQVCIRVLSLAPDSRELPGSTQVLDRPIL